VIHSKMSMQTKRNWWLDAILSVSGMAAIFSGIYFLFLPSGGYRGGRNPFSGLQILFTRQIWNALHTWGGVAMIAAAMLHLALHWSWVVSMIRQAAKVWISKSGKMNNRTRWNLILNLVLGISFSLTALSGVYFLFYPGGRGAFDPTFLFTRATWNLVHTWAGVTLIATAILHFAIHWKWVAKVTRRLFERPHLAEADPQLIPAVNP
jgi:hypothetical protein